MVYGGKRFSDGLRTGKGYLPSIMIKLVEAGERSGSLDKSLQDISEFLDYQVSSSLRNLTALMEPVMLVMVGLSVRGHDDVYNSPSMALLAKSEADNMRGFHLIELIVAIGVSVFFLITVLPNMLTPVTRSSFAESLALLSSDMRTQQLKAMWDLPKTPSVRPYTVST
jgi:hypothetical protein